MSFGDFLALLPQLPDWVPVGWLLFGFVIWFVAQWFARMSLGHEPHKKAVAGWLRHPRYTQLYQWACKPAVDQVWACVCKAPPPKTAGWPVIFKAAMTWRLYEKALVFAVMYPLLAAFAYWLWTGGSPKAGSAQMLPTEPGSWRFLSLAPIPVSIFLITSWRYITRSLKNRGVALSDWQKWFVANDKLMNKVLGLAKILAVLIVLSALAVAVVIPVALSLEIVSKIAGEGTSMVFVIIAGAITIAAFGEGAIAIVCLGLFGLQFMGSELSRLAAAFGGATLSAKKKLHACLFYPLHAMGMCLLICGSVWLLPFQENSAVDNSYFVFFAVFPIINGIFDWVSYSLTLSLLHRGRAAAWPFLWGVLDMIVACALFLFLGITLVAALHGLDQLAGVDLVDLPALLAGVYALKRGDWSQSWALFMVFSTMVPTGLHMLISLIGLQGLWPAKWRRTLAGWIEVDDPSPLSQKLLPMVLGVVWAAPIVLGCAALWALAVWAKPLLGGFFQMYFDLLMWIAQWGGVV